MQSTRKQSFLHGALILSAATAVVKLISALYKIPIQNLISTEAAGDFKIAYDLYATLFIISTAGLPVAVSKMVSEAEAGRRGQESRRIFRVALMTFLVIGVVGTGVLFFNAELLAAWMSAPNAAMAIRVIAPAVFFVAVMCAYRGYYQGQGDMMPTAVSQVIEASCKMVFGLLGAWIVLGMSGTHAMEAAGAMVGVTAGTVFGMVYMIVSGRKRMAKIPEESDGRAARTSKSLFAELMKISVPITISASVLSLTSLIDSALVKGRLQSAAEFTAAETDKVYGVYSLASTLFSLPPAFILTLAVSVIPAIAAAKARRDHLGMNKTILSSLRIMGLLALPAAGGLSALSTPIINLLYGAKLPEEVALAGSLLFALGFAVPFVCLVSLTNSIFQSMGLVNIPVFTMLAGGVVKIVCNWLLVGNPAINIAGAPIGTFCCYATIAILNFAVIRRATETKGMISVFAKPLVATGGMVAAALGVYLLGERLVGAKLAVIAAILLGVVVYLLLLVVLRGILKEDLMLIPKGEKLAKLLHID